MVISCQCYRYREHDEVVNVLGMIEEIYERELLQQENEDSSDDEDTIVITSQTNYQNDDYTLHIFFSINFENSSPAPRLEEYSNCFLH